LDETKKAPSLEVKNATIPKSGGKVAVNDLVTLTEDREGDEFCSGTEGSVGVVKKTWFSKKRGEDVSTIYWNGGECKNPECDDPSHCIVYNDALSKLNKQAASGKAAVPKKDVIKPGAVKATNQPLGLHVAPAPAPHPRVATGDNVTITGRCPGCKKKKPGCIDRVGVVDVVNGDAKVRWDVNKSLTAWCHVPLSYLKVIGGNGKVGSAEPGKTINNGNNVILVADRQSCVGSKGSTGKVVTTSVGGTKHWLSKVIWDCGRCNATENVCNNPSECLVECSLLKAIPASQKKTAAPFRGLPVLHKGDKVQATRDTKNCHALKGADGVVMGASQFTASVRWNGGSCGCSNHCKRARRGWCLIDVGILKVTSRNPSYQAPVPAKVAGKSKVAPSVLVKKLEKSMPSKLPYGSGDKCKAIAENALMKFGLLPAGPATPEVSVTRLVAAFNDARLSKDRALAEKEHLQVDNERLRKALDTSKKTKKASDAAEYYNKADPVCPKCGWIGSVGDTACPSCGTVLKGSARTRLVLKSRERFDKMNSANKKLAADVKAKAKAIANLEKALRNKDDEIVKVKASSVPINEHLDVKLDFTDITDVNADGTGIQRVCFKFPRSHGMVDTKTLALFLTNIAEKKRKK
jgi:hypothetical protein